VVGIVEIDCLVGAVVGGAVDGPAVVQQALQGNGQVTALRVVYGEVVEPGRAAGRRRTARALPRVQSNVVVVAARREEGRLVAEAHQEVKAHQVPVEPDGALQV
jgi:hypothetical protein